MYSVKRSAVQSRPAELRARCDSLPRSSTRTFVPALSLSLTRPASFFRLQLARATSARLAERARPTKRRSAASPDRPRSLPTTRDLPDLHQAAPLHQVRLSSLCTHSVPSLSLPHHLARSYGPDSALLFLPAILISSSRRAGLSVVRPRRQAANRQDEVWQDPPAADLCPERLPRVEQFLLRLQGPQEGAPLPSALSVTLCKLLTDSHDSPQIINSLAKGRPADAALLAAGVRPPRPDAAEQLPVEATTTEAQLFAHASTANGGIVGEGPTTLLQAHKAAFFFKLERELEKVHRSFALSRSPSLDLLADSRPVPRRRSTTSTTSARAPSRSACAPSSTSASSSRRRSPSPTARSRR